MVAINMGTKSVNQTFTIQNDSVSSLTPYQTSASANMARLSAVNTASGTFTYTLPAQSITTFSQY
jgi:glucuronoarabinoxylan endo-1,4-beta-xylanase